MYKTGEGRIQYRRLKLQNLKKIQRLCKTMVGFIVNKKRRNSERQKVTGELNCSPDRV